MSLDLRQIESFVAVAETRNFSVAAQRTNTVQSAISAHIKQLEHRLDRTLVTRGRGQPVSLTAEGAAFLAQARRLLALADEMTHHPGTAQGAAPLRLGTTVTFALSLVPQALAAFAQEDHAPRVTVRTARSHALMDLLETGQIDMALVFDQGAHPMRAETGHSELAWAAHAEFTPPLNTPLPLAFLEDARDLRRHAFAALDTTGTHAISLETHPDPIGLRAVLTAGLAITVLPRIAILAPLADVGPRLGLPKLGVRPISVYATNRQGDGHPARLVRALMLALQRP